MELAKALGISRALLCHHAGILVDAGIVTRRKVDHSFTSWNPISGWLEQIERLRRTA